MQVPSTRDALRTPDRLDARFGAVAGLYVAALLSPTAVFLAVRWLNLRSGPLALGLLGVVGATLAVVVGWQVTRRGELVAWLDSTWLSLLVPALGLVPMVAYSFDAFLFVAIAVAELETQRVASLVGFAGFWLGIIASCLGSALIQMARNRLASAAVDDGDVSVEWTAGWPRRDRLKLGIGVVVVLGPLFALVLWRFQWLGVNASLPLGMVLAVGLSSLAEERTYRVTPAGLETHRERVRFVSRRVVPWSQFEGFSVTDDAVVLHRPLPHVDVRCSRWGLGLDVEEDVVVAALADHLPRRDA
jgi:hypothetical protein